VLTWPRLAVTGAAAGIIAATAAAALGAGALSPGGTGGSSAAASPLAGRPARAFLLAMATQAGRAQVTGRYFCSAITQGDRQLVGPRTTLLMPLWQDGPRQIPAAPPAGFRYALFSRSYNVDCTTPSDDTRHTGYSRGLGARPASPADASAWRRDGSPGHWTTWYTHQTVSAHPGTRRYYTFTKPGTSPWGRSDASLPADPAKLKAIFLAHPLPGHLSRNNNIAEEALAVMQAPVRPAVHQAALRLLASVPGIQMKPGMRDPEGRAGTAVWTPAMATGSLSYETNILLIDPATASILSFETLARGSVEGAPSGTVLNYTAFSFTWTNRLPAKPGS
jgi:hypothetical protein